MSSLRARLLAWLLAGVVLVGAVGGLVVYRNALAEAGSFFDYHLRQTALILRDEPVEYQLTPRFPPQDAAYDFVVQVWSLDGVRVYLSRPHAVLPQITTLGFATVETREGRWRVFGVQAETRVIQVAQPMSVREGRAAELALDTLKPFALLLPVLALFIWFAVGRALVPLERLTALVKARRVDALEALPDARLPDEVQPAGHRAQRPARPAARRPAARARLHGRCRPRAAHPPDRPAPADGDARPGARGGRAQRGDGHALRGRAARHPAGRADAGHGACGAARGPRTTPAGAPGRARPRGRRGAGAAGGCAAHRLRCRQRGGGHGGRRRGRAAHAAAQPHRQRRALHPGWRPRGCGGGAGYRGRWAGACRDR